jgi:hypothetical protein
MSDDARPSHDDDIVHAAATAFRAALERAATEESATHLSYEDLEAHVDGRLEGAETARVTAHLRECSACRTDVQELETFSRSLQKETGRPGVISRLARELRSWRPWDVRILVPAAAFAVLLVVFLREDSPPGLKPPEPAPVAANRPAVKEALPQQYRSVVEQALTTRRLEVPAFITDLTGRGGILLGTPAEGVAVGSLRPVGTVVEQDRPVFTWVGPRGAQYKISVYDDRYNEVGASGWIATTQWTMPESLTRGSRYSWQLTMRRGENETIVPAPPAPEARFQVLGAEELNELTAVRKTHGNSHLLLAVLYARVGLVDDAERELETLALTDPDSAVVADLSASLKKARGL